MKKKILVLCLLIFVVLGGLFAAASGRVTASQSDNDIGAFALGYGGVANKSSDSLYIQHGPELIWGAVYGSSSRTNFGLYESLEIRFPLRSKTGSNDSVKLTGFNMDMNEIVGGGVAIHSENSPIALTIGLGLHLRMFMHSYHGSSSSGYSSYSYLYTRYLLGVGAGANLFFRFSDSFCLVAGVNTAFDFIDAYLSSSTYSSSSSVTDVATGFMFDGVKAHIGLGVNI